MKKAIIMLMLFATLFSILPVIGNATSRSDGKEIVELTKGIEHKLNEKGFVTYVNIDDLPEDVADNFRRIGVASYGGSKPDISRFKWVDFITASSLYDDTRGYGSVLPQSGTYYPMTILYDVDNMPLAYQIGTIEFTGNTTDAGSSGTGSNASLDHLEATEQEIVLGVGKSQKLKVYAIYTNGEEKEVTADKGLVIRSESAAIADIKKGIVTAGNKVGSTNLVITYLGKKLTITVKVTKDTAMSIKASTKKTILTVGDTKQIKLAGTFSDGKVKDITNLAVWTTDDNDIADIDTGEVEAVAEGTTTITANYNGLTVAIEVTVISEEEEEAIQYVSLVASNKNIKLLPGDEKTIRIYGFTEDGQKVEVTDEVLWQTSKSDVVDADSGILTAGKPGKAVVYVSHGSTEFAFNVEVIKEKDVKAVISSPSKIEIKKGSEKQLFAEALYIDNVKIDVTDRAVWTVKNDSILEVDGGTLTALKKGKTIITVKYKGKFTNIEVTVK
ncbi:Ig-like domain-containing protein [Paenibacillus sp. LHD-38]|uniref:Ig-like domain-containing protein n=1 Tax=Paenibacillus sp. LHD-38 TaxID=3072143 RepID=UPI00280F76E4|nr:Ig-like domain-containing protein [Paenibacillus sp. LHD-38]MDQ8736210.1 Ig-like domain-containing protein [Paenibacillus sp. LHD-38]